MRKRVLIVALSLVLFSPFWGTSCGSRLKLGPPVWELSSGMGPERQAEICYSFPTPRTSHPAGYVYRTSKPSKNDVHVTTVGEGQRQEFPESVPPFYSEVSTSYAAGLLAAGGIDLRKEQRSRIRVELEECTRETLTEAALVQAIGNANIDFNTKESYYVVQTVLKAKKVTVEFEDSGSLTAELRAEVDRLATSGTLSRSSTRKTEYSREFAVPHQICYMPLRIDVRGPLTSGAERILLSEANDGDFVE